MAAASRHIKERHIGLAFDDVAKRNVLLNAGREKYIVLQDSNPCCLNRCCFVLVGNSEYQDRVQNCNNS